jgi:hypothetical protein
LPKVMPAAANTLRFFLSSLLSVLWFICYDYYSSFPSQTKQEVN